MDKNSSLKHQGLEYLLYSLDTAYASHLCSINEQIVYHLKLKDLLKLAAWAGPTESGTNRDIYTTFNSKKKSHFNWSILATQIKSFSDKPLVANTGGQVSL